MEPVKLEPKNTESKNTEQDKLKKRRRGVYLLPNLFTTFGLFAGFYAIISASNGKFTPAAIAIIIAMILDGVDGRVARMTNTQTDFGAEYDSLADMVSFGIAPALVVYEWSLKSMMSLGPELAKLGWLAAFFYAAMAALRLARFNVQTDTIDKRYFRGLPSPAAAGLVISFIWVCESLGWAELKGSEVWLYSLIFTIAAGSLMISPIFYNSFKDKNREEKIPFRGAAAIVLVLVLVIINPPVVLFGVFFLYAFSGPVLSVLRWSQKKKMQDTPE